MVAEYLTARIRSIEPGLVQIIKLELERGVLRFAAGQYLNVVHPDGERIPFSIATPPSRLPQLELHFQPTPGHPQSALMEDALKGDSLRIEGPFGGTVLDKAKHTSLLFVCAGSGVAQALSMIESVPDESNRNFEIKVLWCCENVSATYVLKRFQALGAEVSKNLCVDPVRNSGSAGFRQLRHLVVSTSPFDAFLCGSPGFVWAVTDVLIGLGCSASNLHSDVYDYAPRGGSN
ncbi:MAG: hypothetical protein FJ194_01120 [Gammaproteobacteria bacterium]|nr:hypothetical protein [Gammaproteobacteria bacterium]